MKHFPVLFIILFCAGCRSNHAKQPVPDVIKYTDTSKRLYYTEATDSSMNKAINLAKTSISKFDSAFLSDHEAYTDFAIKKRYSLPNGGGGEHIWVAVSSITANGYNGYINNDVEKAEGIKYGDSVFVFRNEITDWMFLDHNILRGGFTIREARNNSTPEEKIKFDKDLGFKIED